jgi:hypothetical protein
MELERERMGPVEILRINRPEATAFIEKRDPIWTGR